MRIAFYFACILAVHAQESLDFPSLDGLPIRADYYAPNRPSNTLILLCHQADWSRGEYRETAAWLAENGFACLAIDQRSGKTVNGIENETHKRALANKKPTRYLDAKQDVEAAIAFARAKYKPSKLILVGSSYSAMLAFRIAGEGKFPLTATVCFSPGEYLPEQPGYLAEVAAKIAAPVFISSPPDEQELWQGFAAKINPKLLSSFLPAGKGAHGSRALWKAHADSEGYRRALAAFLAAFR